MGRLRCDTKSIPGSLVLRWMDCFPPKTTRKSDSEDFLETVFMERNYRYECRKHKNRYHRTGQHVLCHRKGFYYPWRNRSDPDYRQRTEPGETGEQLQDNMK